MLCEYTWQNNTELYKFLDIQFSCKRRRKRVFFIIIKKKESLGQKEIQNLKEEKMKNAFNECLDYFLFLYESFFKRL